MGTVQFENVCKRFGDVSIVENLNLTVADGEFMVLLGPSGCGKSTTLRMIAGLETMSEGTISIDGAVMNNVTAKDRDIAMVFQSYALYPHMSVEGNLAFGLKRRSMSKAEIAKRVAAAASTLGLDSLLHRKPHALSGGQRQRVALGRAIVREPKVFLFDEPLSNLDAALRVGMRSELIDLHRRLGSTMIYVTHDQVEAMTMGSRICIMHDGRIMQVGSPLDVYRNPNSVFVAQFLGSPPMNLLTVALDRPAGRAIVAEQAGFDIPDSIFRRCGGRNDVTLGIRPEDFRAVSAASGKDTVCMAARVLRIEHLGAEMLVTCHLLNQKTTVVARLDPRFDIDADAGITLEVDAPKIQCFDAQSGAAISQQ